MSDDQKRYPKEYDGHVCHPRHVKKFDNFLRPFVHSPKKLFGPYVKPGMTALDVGCGRGFASIGLARLVGQQGRVISADLQEEMLDMVRERAGTAGLADRITYHRCGKTSIGFDGAVDFIVAFYMVHETPDKKAFFRETFSLLNPGARMMVAEPLFHISKKGFEKEIESARATGFQVVDRPRVLGSRAVVLGRPGA